MGYAKTILPKDLVEVDLFAIRAYQPGIVLHRSIVLERDPNLEENGLYHLFYKLFSKGFPFLQFVILINLQWIESKPWIIGQDLNWDFRSSANLL
jgi:hypothetical protein